MRYEEAGPWRGKGGRKKKKKENEGTREGKGKKKRAQLGGFVLKTYSTQMPRDMAMERPDARVIRAVLQHHVPVRSQIVRVPPQRVLRVDDGVAVPLAVAFVQDPVFVAMEMHWLRKAHSSASSNYHRCVERRQM